MKKALIIFTKNAEMSKVKTRLAASLGDEQAFLIYKKLIDHTARISESVDVNRFVFYSSFIDPCDEWDSQYFTKRLQIGNDLGERMLNAFVSLFAEGYEFVNIIGCDCPGITAQIIDDGFTALQHTDVVIGPAKDGGYYLLGLKKVNSELFKNISWSTSRVLSQTISACSTLNISIYFLCELFDVDVEDDITDLAKYLSGNFEQ